MADDKKKTSKKNSERIANDLLSHNQVVKIRDVKVVDTIHLTPPKPSTARIVSRFMDKKGR